MHICISIRGLIQYESNVLITITNHKFHDTKYGPRIVRIRPWYMLYILHLYYAIILPKVNHVCNDSQKAVNKTLTRYDNEPHKTHER